VVTARIWNVVGAIGGAVIAYQSARTADAVMLRVVHPPRGEVLLISDVILATALGVAVYLWLRLRVTRGRVTDLERAQIVVDTQLSLAADIQRQLLPSISSGANGLRWAGRLEPANRIGGDFYDFIPGTIDDVFMVGDVSGKGIPAALLQASVHSLFRTLAREVVDPALLLTRLSHEIYAENSGGSYLTCVLARVNTKTRTVMYVNAGHPAGMIVGSSGRRLLARGGPPLGLFADTAYESEVLSAEAGDLGVIVSDGITEALEQDGVAIVDVLNRTICSIAGARTPERVCEVLMEKARHSSGPRGVAHWQDDKTVLAFLFDDRAA
jgi:sigma-B regulation protein RsbU (phosphoserine phosphatase)